MRFRRRVIVFVVLSCLVAGPYGQDEPREQEAPLDLGVREKVEVQFVLVDFLVLDRKDRTVPDLTIENFSLLVDSKEVAIESLDKDCTAGAEDPRSGPRRIIPEPVESLRPRRIVLAFDYYHMHNVAETFDDVVSALDRWATGEEEHMLVSIGEVVRIETPFTKDREELRWALLRMRNDRDLYAGTNVALTELGFFERIKVLFDLLEMYPGRKTIVLFSGPLVPDGFEHDPQFKELSALSTTTRTAVYPVDTAGLRTGPGASLGGPEKLRRLANETGGRMTANTNDIGLAYGKAHRDLGCTYTLGFRDAPPRFDRDRRITIRIEGRKGLRVVYPQFYVVRSPEEKRESLVHTASMAPQMFDSDELNAGMFVVGPVSLRKWRTVLGVEIRLGPGVHVEPDSEWEMKGIVRKPNGTIVHSFERTVVLPGSDPVRGANPVVTLFQEILVRPGRYIVSAVLADPRGEVPRTTSRPVELAAVPRGAPFLIGPILGHRAEPGDRPGEARDRTHPEFRPLLEAETDRGDPLDALTLLCIAQPDSPVGMLTIAREITTLDGEGVRRFGDVAVRLDGRRDLQCEEMLDAVPAETLEPGRYEITASSRSSEVVTESATTEFEVVP